MKPWKKLVLRFLYSPAFYLLAMTLAGAIIGAILWPILWPFDHSIGFLKCVGCNAAGWIFLTAAGHPAMAKREDEVKS